MKKLGQHFLKNKSVLKKIVDALEIKDGDRVIEIGPGHGELTVPLLDVIKISNGTLLGIEKDHDMIANLETLAETPAAMAEAPAVAAIDAHLTIKEGDALEVLPEIVPPTPSKYKLAGNIPYYITGKLLRVISELPNKPSLTVLLVQKEVAERLCATAPRMNRLAASVRFWAEPKIVATALREDFSPPPDVDSAVLVLKTKPDTTIDKPRSTINRGDDLNKDIDPQQYYKTVRAVFAQPRKTLVNNLRAIAGKNDTTDDIIRRLGGLKLSPSLRPQDLSVEEIIAIAKLFEK